LIEAVIFDLDGVLIDSESAWAEVRREFVLERGGRWQDHTQRDMMGMSSVEWSRYIHDELGVDMPPTQISAEVARRLALLYRARLPLVPGAHDVVDKLAARRPLALASSSNRELIDLVLEVAHLARYFQATVSSEEVARGKPARDVYLEAARRLEIEPSRCAAIEDSHNGILAAAAAGMRVIAIPNREFAPGREALAKAARVLASLEELTPEVIEGVGR
jgi:HAD superfamily hydrolase (TIGR01509 family)